MRRLSHIARTYARTPSRVLRGRVAAKRVDERNTNSLGHAGDHEGGAAPQPNQWEVATQLDQTKVTVRPRAPTHTNPTSPHQYTPIHTNTRASCVQNAPRCSSRCCGESMTALFGTHGRTACALESPCPRPISLQKKKVRVNESTRFDSEVTRRSARAQKGGAAETAQAVRRPACAWVNRSASVRVRSVCGCGSGCGCGCGGGGGEVGTSASGWTPGPAAIPATPARCARPAQRVHRLGRLSTRAAHGDRKSVV